MKRQHASPYGVVSATILSLLGTIGATLVPDRYDSVWLSLFAASFIALYFSVNIAEVKADENS